MITSTYKLKAFNAKNISIAVTRLSERVAQDSAADRGYGTPRTVIRGESPTAEKNKSQAALTDWLNVSFPFHSENNKPLEFFKSFSEATKGIFGGMTDQQRGLHGWQYSFQFDHGCVLFAYGGQNNTAFLSLPGEGCALISEWRSFALYLRDRLRARITRWDGAVDDFNGVHSVDMAIESYKQGHFKHGGREPKLIQYGNWIKPDGSGRSVYVGSRKNGKLIRIYEKGKQLGDPSSLWVRWEVELYAKDRIIPWEVLLHPGEYARVLILAYHGFLIVFFASIQSKNKIALAMSV